MWVYAARRVARHGDYGGSAMSSTSDDATTAGGTGYPPPSAAERPLDPTLGKRPGSLAFGCGMTWIGSSYGLLLSLFLAIGVARDGVGGTSGRLLLAFGGFQALWCLLAFLFAALAYQGRRWAVYALVAFAAVWVALAVLGSVLEGPDRTLVGAVYSAVAATLVFVGFRSWQPARR